MPFLTGAPSSPCALPHLVKLVGRGVRIALHPLLQCPERMHGGRSGPRAVGMPRFALELELIPVRGARHCEVQALNHLVLGHALNHLHARHLVNAISLHAPGQKLVLTVVSEVCMLAVLPRQDALAVLKVGQKRPESGLGHDLETAMEAHPHVLAVLEEDAILGHVLMAQQLTQSLGDEDRWGVALHDPGEALPSSCLPDLFPDSQEQGQVYPGLGVGPSQHVREVDLDGLSRVQLDLNVAVDGPVVACEDVRVPLLRFLQDFQLMGRLLRARVAERHCKTVQRGSHQLPRLRRH